MTALLWSMEVNVNAAHGGGLSPGVTGELHTPAVWGVLTCHSRMMMGTEVLHSLVTGSQQCTSITYVQDSVHV